MSIEPTVPCGIVGASELVALVCLVPLWRSGGSIRRRLGWTLALMLPVIGPVMFGAFRGGALEAGDGFPPAPPRGRGGSHWV